MLDIATIGFIKEHRNEDVRTLALQAKRHPNVNMLEAVTQIEGWQQAREKLPTWAAIDGIIYPPKISMEQCSSEQTAKYKASLIKGERFADLTGGFGIDFSYIARGFNEAYYIERNERLCNIATANFSLLELEEDLLSKAGNVMIKCSPMLDITMACRQLKNVSEAHVVAVNNECKELLFIIGNSTANCSFHCVNILKDGVQTFAFTQEDESSSTAKYSNTVGAYLYEPNATIQKAGCHNTLSQRLEIGKLHPNSQLYTSDNPVPDFPGRTFEVVEVLGFSKADIKKVQALGKANITVRNFPDNVQQLRKRLKLADGGDSYIFATTLANDSKALIVCRK